MFVSFDLLLPPPDSSRGASLGQDSGALGWGSASKGWADAPALPLEGSLGVAQALVLIRLAGKYTSWRFLPFPNLAETGKTAGRDDEQCNCRHLASSCWKCLCSWHSINPPLEAAVRSLG